MTKLGEKKKKPTSDIDVLQEELNRLGILLQAEQAQLKT